MTELTKPVAAVDGAPFGAGHDLDGTPSVRELLTELAALEDATRAHHGTLRERLAALAREQEIIDELHRRCPEANGPTCPSS